MKSRRWVTWLIFTVCALAVLEGLGWVTWKALRLERAEREARAQADFQELIRLALWRMDSEVTPILAREAARPYFHYQPFYAAGRAYTRMLQEIQPDEVRVPSPLLDATGPYMLIHYQIGPDGRVTSPQAPTGNLRDLAESQYVDSEFIELAGERLRELDSMVRPAPSAPAAPERELAKQISEAPQEAPAPNAPAAATPQPARQEAPAQQGQSFSQPVQTMISEKEYQARQQAANSAVAPIENRRGKASSDFASKSRKEAAAPSPAPQAVGETGGAGGGKDLDQAAPRREPAPGAKPGATEARGSTPAGDEAGAYRRERKTAMADELLMLKRDVKPEGGAKAPAVDVSEVELSAFQPIWRRNPRTEAPELLLRRTVTIAGATLEQGIWMDWPALRARLLTITRDLIPAAHLVPVLAPPQQAPTAQMLASFPVLLRPGDPPAPAPEPLLSSAHMTLGVTWLAALAGVLAIGLVLRTSMELSDRRGRFVSAVTHELRTPLTTFRLYTGMLAGGMVPDEAARREYLSTLEHESGRLAGIVENVLDYARLGGRPARHDTAIAVADLIAQVMPSLARAAQGCGLALALEGSAPPGAIVRADPATVERILLNLVDNSCKYAADAADRRLHVAIRVVERPIRRRFLELSVRDHGPGIPAAERRRVFRAFHRAKRDQQGPQSGLGLGLALSRGLARELQGDLEVGRTTRGALLRLLLPITEQNA